MTSLLDAALRALVSELGPGAEARVDRVDLREGAMTLTLVDGRGDPRWYRFDDSGLARLEPLGDERIPLAAWLREATEDTPRVLAWRPGRRLVVALARDARVDRVLKGYRRRRSADAARRHRVASAAAGAAGLSVARLVEHDEALEALAFAPVPGVPPRLAIRGRTVLGHFARAFAAFAATETPDWTEARAPEDELSVLEHWRSVHELATGAVPTPALRQREVLAALAGSLAPTPLALCHRDLHDGQLLVHESRAALLDFDLLCRADPALDIGNLLAHVHLRALQAVRGATRESAAVLRQALLDVLVRVRPDALELGRRLSFWESAALLRLSFVYGVRPRWRHLAPLLVEASKRCTEVVGVA